MLAKYDPKTRQNEVVFYGTSNFRLWEQFEEDMKPSLDAFLEKNEELAIVKKKYFLAWFK